MRSRTAIAVFASGGGSNLGALLDYFDALGEARSADVSVVLSDRSEAPALERARARGIPAVVLDDFRDGDAICRHLTDHRVQLVVLAGYLRLLPREVIAAFPRRIVNVHPAPLPAFGGKGMYGLKVHQAVLSAGVAETAVSIHFVDEEYDRGAVIAQWPIEVRADDTAESLASRVLSTEHLIYPRIVEMVAALITPGS